MTKLHDIDKETHLRIVLRTPVKLNKKDKAGNPNELEPIFKLQEQIIVINRDYAEAVNEQRKDENKVADFTSNGRNWGTQANAIITKDDGTEYLSYILTEQSAKPVYVYGNNVEVDKEVFEPFMPASKPSTKQDVANEVKARTAKLENVLTWEKL